MPEASVVSVRPTCVSRLIRRTSAPTMWPPDVSVTTPVRLLLLTWASVVVEKSRAINMARMDVFVMEHLFGTGTLAVLFQRRTDMSNIRPALGEWPGGG